MVSSAYKSRSQGYHKEFSPKLIGLSEDIIKLTLSNHELEQSTFLNEELTLKYIVPQKQY